MRQLRDAAYIRQAATFGYPAGDDGDGWNGEAFPALPRWLWTDEKEAAYGETYNQL